MPGTPDRMTVWPYIAGVAGAFAIVPLVFYFFLVKISELGIALVGLKGSSASGQISSPAMRAHFTAPPNGAKVPRKPLLSRPWRTFRRGSRFGWS